MAEQEHWTDRRQRVVRCKIHGLHFDPRMTSGCALCRKEGFEAEPRQKPQLVVMLLALLGAAVILYRIFGPGATESSLSDTDFSVAGGAPVDGTVVARASSQLDTVLFRPHIEAIDRALFEPSGTEREAMGEEILFALDQLRRKLSESSSATAIDTVREIERMTEGINTASISQQILQNLRGDWLRLRDRVFPKKSWFANPVTADTRTDRVAIATYRDVARDLISLLDEGSSEARIISEPTAPNYMNPEDAARKREAWDRFQADWRRRIVDLRNQLPARPGAESEPQVLLAAQRLEQALSRISSLAATKGPPSQPRIEEAFEMAERAQRSLDDLLLR